MEPSKGMVNEVSWRRSKTMNTSKVIACLKEAGFKPSIDSFEHRLVIQKFVYLLQLKGIKTGFEYTLHVRGPYSRSLCKQMYDNKDDFQHLQNPTPLNKTETEQVQLLVELFQMKPNLLEVAATYTFFYQQNNDAISSLRMVKKLKPFFKDSEIAVGISKAKEFLFPPSQENITAMKREMSGWMETTSDAFGR